MWCWGRKIPPLTNTRTQQLCTRHRAHPPTDHDLGRSCSPGPQPNPDHPQPCPLDSGQGWTQCYHPGPPHRKCGFILGEANVPVPASLPHAHLLLGLLTPQLPLLGQTYSKSRAGPHRGAPQPGGLGVDTCCRPSVQPTAPLDPSSRRATPSLAGLSRFCPRPMSGRSQHLRAGLPKPSSDSAAAAVSSLHWPQILEDSSRGLQGVGGSRSACSSCSSAWLRRYISM